MKVKICPECHFKNPVERNFCLNDLYDIESVAPTDDETAPLPPSPESQTGSDKYPDHPMGGVRTRRVDAGADPDGKATRRVHPVAHFVGIDSRRFIITSGAVIGRRPAADIDLTDVPNGDTVSRSHARCTCDGGMWFMEILSETNASFVDNNCVHVGERVPLRNGARVILGEASFVFQTS